MPLYGYVNELNDITNRLEDAQILLRSVCDNYFGYTEKGTDPAMLYSQYSTFSSLVHMATNIIWDLEKEYESVSEKIFDVWKSMKIESERVGLAV